MKEPSRPNRPLPNSVTAAHGMRIFVTGATGYLGRRLVTRLVMRGHNVKSLMRKGAQVRLPGLKVVGDAMDLASFSASVAPAESYVHLVGVRRPKPWQRKRFREIDLASLQASIAAAKEAKVKHFVYVSVAHPAPIMRAYIKVRIECERLLEASGLHVTILRPWYVLGPGHRWPMLLTPWYWLLRLLPWTRAFALRLGLVRLEEMINALVWAVENPAVGVRIVDVPGIREHAKG